MLAHPIRRGRARPGDIAAKIAPATPIAWPPRTRANLDRRSFGRLRRALEAADVRLAACGGEAAEHGRQGRPATRHRRRTSPSPASTWPAPSPAPDRPGCRRRHRHLPLELRRRNSGRPRQPIRRTPSPPPALTPSRWACRRTDLPIGSARYWSASPPVQGTDHVHALDDALRTRRSRGRPGCGRRRSRARAARRRRRSTRRRACRAARAPSRRCRRRSPGPLWLRRRVRDRRQRRRLVVGPVHSPLVDLDPVARLRAWFASVRSGRPRRRRAACGRRGRGTARPVTGATPGSTSITKRPASVSTRRALGAAGLALGAMRDRAIAAPADHEEDALVAARPSTTGPVVCPPHGEVLPSRHDDASRRRPRLHAVPRRGGRARARPARSPASRSPSRTCSTSPAIRPAAASRSCWRCRASRPRPRRRCSACSMPARASPARPSPTSWRSR